MDEETESKSYDKDWIGETPKSWELVRIRYLARVQTGNTPSKSQKKYYSTNYGVPWVKPDGLTEFLGIVDSKEKLTEKGCEKARVVRKGSILVCCIGSVGKMGVAGCDLATNQQINSITFSSLVQDNYGKFAVYAAAAEHKRLANDNVVPILNADGQKSIVLPIPSLQVQDEIANYLDHNVSKIASAIHCREQQALLLKEYKQAIVQQTITHGMNPNQQQKYADAGCMNGMPANWNIARIKNYINVFHGDSLNVSEKTKYRSTNQDHLPYIASKDIDINTGDINYENGLRIPMKDGYRVCPSDTTLLCIEGGSAGQKIAYTDKNVCFVNKLACFITSKEIDSKFFYYYLSSQVFKEQFYQSMTGIIGGVSISSIKNFVFPLPPISEQSAIRDHLDAELGPVNDAISRCESQITLLEEYKAALINKIVTGKIKVI